MGILPELLKLIEKYFDVRTLREKQEKEEKLISF